MKEGWEYKKLGEVCEITMGQSPDSSTYNKECVGMPFFQGCADFGEIYPRTTTYCSAPKKIANIKDILMSVRAPIGTLNIADKRCCIGRGLAALSEKQNISNYKFIFYFLKASQKDLQNKGTGATFKAIGKELIINYSIPVPPLSEQQRIVEELDLLSSIIEKKKAQLKELDSLAQSIFYDMFGDPVTNKKGWEVKKLGEIAKSKIGLTYKPADVAEEGTIVLRSSNIQNSTIELTDIVRVSCNINEDKFVKEGDILMCSRNGSFKLVGKVARIKNLSEKMSYGAFMTIIRSCYNDYLFQFFKSPAFRVQLGLAKTATINQITVKMLDSIKVGVPSFQLQQQFAEKVEAIEHQKELIKQSIKEVETLFNSRMDYYFN